MLDPFDKSRCSFAVPDFASEEEEQLWASSLTPEQGFELLHLMRLERWGEKAVNRPMDRTCVRQMTMDEFNAMKAAEGVAENAWRVARGLAPRYSRDASKLLP